jgi:nucleotide-binding universal stress UspA family protein
MCDSRVQVHAPPFSFVILVQGQRHAAQTAVAWKPGARHRVDVGHVLEARPPTPDHSKGAFMVKYSLVGYDGSDASRRAFQFAIDLARCANGRVRVVSVLQVTEGGADASALMMADSGTRRVQELLEELTSIVPDATTLVDVEMVYGSPGDVLLGQIDQHGVDHIVIGHTERGALARWLLGSVSSNVLARAHVPVTVVR